MRIYLDNAATSWPKPKGVMKGMKQYLQRCGGNPGRSGHRKSIEAARMVLETREAVGELFSVKDPANIIFTKNATEAINIVLFGIMEKGDHLVTTSMEHNSVLRPANALREKGVEVTVVFGDETGKIDPEKIKEACGPETKLVAVTHASNVTGAVQDIAAISKICKEKGVLLLVDAAQSAGVVPIDLSENPIDFLAASGHKGLLGPQGTGCLCLNGTIPKPLLFGGTGSLSDKDIQPDFLPDMLESGTINTVGIAGLYHGVRYVLDRGIDDIMRHDRKLLEIFMDKLSAIPGINIMGPKGTENHTGVLSITADGVSSSKIGELLDTDYGIYTRIGLHCAPKAHETIGTFPRGTVRFGWGPFTKVNDVLRAAFALQEIIRKQK